MTAQELAEIAHATYNITGLDRAAIVVRVKENGNMRMTSYGEPDALMFIYKVLTKAWKDYGEGMTDVCGVSAQYRID